MWRCVNHIMLNVKIIFIFLNVVNNTYSFQNIWKTSTLEYCQWAWGPCLKLNSEKWIIGLALSLFKSHLSGETSTLSLVVGWARIGYTVHTKECYADSKLHHGPRWPWVFRQYQEIFRAWLAAFMETRSSLFAMIRNLQCWETAQPDP